MSRRTRIHGLVDGLVAATLTGWILVEGDRPLRLVATVVGTLALALAGRRPLLVGVGVPLLYGGAAIALGGLDNPPAYVAVLVAGLHLGRGRGGAWWPVAAAVPGVVALGAFDLDSGGAANVVFLLGTWGVAVAAGSLLAARTADEAAAGRREAATRAGTEQARASAVRDERERIAHDLHHVVTHGVSLMVVSSVAGAAAVGPDPTAAGEAFDTIEAAGIATLQELRTMLGLLREPPR